MSLLQNEEYETVAPTGFFKLTSKRFTIYRLRTSYLSTIKDGVGERLITVNPAILNTPGFRSAGWQPNLSEIKRTYSPPIPTAITSEYFQVPSKSVGHSQIHQGDDDDEGGMISGVGGTGETVGPTLHSKRRRLKHQLEEEDSSDLSDESDDEGESGSRAAQSIRFAKMPVRHRSGSSPIRSSTAKEGPSVLVTSPPRLPGSQRLRRGSLGAVEAVKERARRDTATSSELSSENELGPPLFKRKQVNPIVSGRSAGVGEEQHRPIRRQQTKDSTDLEDEDSVDDSEGSVVSSDFDEAAGSESLLGSVTGPLTTSLPSIPTQLGGLATSGRAPASPGRLGPKTKGPIAVMEELPPPRPISMILPVSALTQAIKAKRSKAASPFESFAILSGKGDPNPLQLQILAAHSPSNRFPVTICRTTQAGNSGDGQAQRQVTVADAIGLSLWRYIEDKIEPRIVAEKMNVNWWSLRMVEDGEVDYDFPALERNKSIVSFASNNNRGGRARSNSKPFDEFALVEATSEQFKENSRVTPNFKQESTASSMDVSTPIDEEPPPIPSVPSILPPRAPRARNPFISQFPAAAPTLRPDFTIPSSTSGPAPRTGVSKILRIHLEGSDPWSSQIIALDVTTDTYMADVLATACQKRNLEKAHHIFKISGTNVIVPTDRTVESLGSRADLDLILRRFAHDGPLALTGSPTSTSPNTPLLVEDKIEDSGRPRGGSSGKVAGKRPTAVPVHPLSQAADVLPSHPADFKRYTVWRKQPMSFLPTHERTLSVDGDFLTIMPGETGVKSGGLLAGATHRETGKTSTIHFSNVVGAKCKGRGAGFKIIVFREGAGDNKRYDFEAINREEAREIVAEVAKGLERFRGEV
ncbi:MAG: hypothetical protein M1814_002065 [Vezdaea aestivalis]|nr:MAG: hypothetical protein M1814_002065 [Vezdaea aestivalis]